MNSQHNCSTRPLRSKDGDSNRTRDLYIPRLEWNGSHKILLNSLEMLIV